MKSHLYPLNTATARWQQVAIAITLASLCLITLITLLQASPTTANGPYPIVTVILQEGATPANGGGLPVAFLNPPVTNGNGQVSFSGSLDNGTNDTEFIWYNSGLTWLSNGLISDVLSIEEVIGSSNNGNYAMSLLLNPNSVDSLWTDDGLLLAEGDPAPDIPGYYIVGLSRATMQTNGLVNWFAAVSDTPGGPTQFEVIYHASDVSTPIINAVLQGGTVISNSTIANTGLDPDFFVSDDGTHLITLIQTTAPITQDEYIYLDGALLLREGEPTGTGDNWDNFDLFQVNNSGNYVVSGDTDGNAASDEFIAYNGLIQVREGDTIGGVTLNSTASVRQLSLNNLGQAAFTWTILGGQEILFFACDPTDMAQATAVLATNDLVDTDGDGSADATITDFNTSAATQSFMLAEDGQIYVEVDLDYGGGSLEAIIQYTLPSCTGNTAPIAVNDSYTTTQATPLIIPAPGVLGNDIEGGGGTLTAVPIQPPSHGNLTLNPDGSFTYSPNPGYAGTDSFTYRAFDGQFLSNLATVVITVTGNNPNPGLQIDPLSLASTQAANTLNVLTLTFTNSGNISIDWAFASGPFNPYQNGPVVNRPGGGLGGADASVLQVQGLGMTGRGYGNGVSDNNRIADELIITDPAGWLIDTMTFYAYQTNSPLSSTITAVNLRIWDGPPNVTTSTIIFGDTSTNRLIETTWSGAYRTADNENPNDNIRPIMANTITAATYLSPGTYWLDWQTDGDDNLTGPWAPPIVISNVMTTGNALQATSSGQWVSIIDSGSDTPQGIPFQVSGCQRPNWVSVNPTNNTLAPGTADHIAVTFDATGLSAGTYTGELCFTTSDSSTPFIRLPITLTSLASSILLTTTIGLNPDECAPNTTLYTTEPVTVYYCYTVTNNGTISLTRHDLETDVGSIFSNHMTALYPGESFNTISAGLTLTPVAIITTTVTTATWTAYNPGQTDLVTTTDIGAVIFGTPGLVLVPTVGALAESCATQSEISVPAGTTIYYCYTVTNTGDIPLEVHSLTETAYGPIFLAYPRTLNPGASFNTVAEGLPHSQPMMADVTSTAVWTASNGPLISIVDSGTTAVTAFTVRTTYLPFVIRP